MARESVDEGGLGLCRGTSLTAGSAALEYPPAAAGRKEERAAGVEDELIAGLENVAIENRTPWDHLQRELASEIPRQPLVGTSLRFPCRTC